MHSRAPDICCVLALPLSFTVMLAVAALGVAVAGLGVGAVLAETGVAVGATIVLVGGARFDAPPPTGEQIDPTE